MKSQLRDLTGKQFGRLTVLSYVGRAGRYNKWLARCVCKNERIVTSDGLLSGDTKSCGCLLKDKIREANRTHGMSKTRQYKIWGSMIRRCYNRRSDQHKWYGGRGITVCKKWVESFEAFWADMQNGYDSRLTLDRIDVDGNYEPRNCRWVDKKTQARNTRANRLVDTPWGRVTLAEAAEKSGVPRETIASRLNAGVVEWDQVIAPSTRSTAPVFVETPLGNLRLAEAARLLGVNEALVRHRLSRGWPDKEALLPRLEIWNKSFRHGSERS